MIEINVMRRGITKNKTKIIHLISPNIICTIIVKMSQTITAWFFFFLQVLLHAQSTQLTFQGKKKNHTACKHVYRHISRIVLPSFCLLLSFYHKWGFFCFFFLSLLIMRAICLNQPHCGAAALHGNGEHISKSMGVHKPISSLRSHSALRCMAAKETTISLKHLTPVLCARASSFQSASTTAVWPAYQYSRPSETTHTHTLSFFLSLSLYCRDRYMLTDH